MKLVINPDLKNEYIAILFPLSAKKILIGILLPSPIISYCSILYSNIFVFTHTPIYFSPPLGKIYWGMSRVITLGATVRPLALVDH